MQSELIGFSRFYVVYIHNFVCKTLYDIFIYYKNTRLLYRSKV